jgi:hypothetical protein
VEEEDDRPRATGVTDEELAARGDVDGQAGKRVTRRSDDPRGERPTMPGRGNQRSEEEPAERRDLRCLAGMLEVADNRS